MHAYAIVVSWREAGDTRGIVSVRTHTHTRAVLVLCLSVATYTVLPWWMLDVHQGNGVL